MKSITVLFTAVCGMPTCATVDALRQSMAAEFIIIGVDCSPDESALNYVDFLYKVPRCTDAEYVPCLLDICRRHNIDIVIPLISDEINVMWEHMDDFEKVGAKMLLSGKDSFINIANDKLLLNQYLVSHGLDIMPKTFAYSSETADENLCDLGYPDKPVVMKLKDGCGAVGFRILDERKANDFVSTPSRSFRSNPYITKEQLVQLGNAQKGRYMLQEYLPGKELSTICLVDHGRTIYSPSHDNMEMQGAITTTCELVDCKEASSIAEKINELLNLDGNIGYDFKRDSDGKLKLLEVNPRVTATVSLAAKAGLNLVEMGVLHALGFDIDEDITPLYGVRLHRMYGALFSFGGKPYGR